MTNTICLNEKYSTTRLVTREKPEVANSLEDKFETVLFLPEGEGRKGEGGLRTKGYFKKSHQDKPLISIITAVFNGEKFLEETIQSIINQTYDNVEYIIIDGGSTDATLDIIKKYEDRIDYWVSEPDKGIYDAWNKALRVAKGEWIMFVGADDFLSQDALEKYCITIGTLSEDVEYISAMVEIIDTDKNSLAVRGQAWSWNVFRKYMNVAHVASLHRKTLFDRLGAFDASYRIAGDYELLLRAKDTLRASFLDDVVAQMTNNGASNSQIHLVLKETMRAKSNTAGCSVLACKFDLFWALLKIKIREILS
jgi:glycosyltransferase involved in cell wall biosynthesis